jgi:hypothetical protein
MKVSIDLCGGLETLFGGDTKIEIEVDEGTTMEALIEKMKTEHLKEREELFI